jgi:hypothetical protein
MLDNDEMYCVSTACDKCGKLIRKDVMFSIGDNMFTGKYLFMKLEVMDWNDVSTGHNVGLEISWKRYRTKILEEAESNVNDSYGM